MQIINISLAKAYEIVNFLTNSRIPWHSSQNRIPWHSL